MMSDDGFADYEDYDIDEEYYWDDDDDNNNIAGCLFSSPSPTEADRLFYRIVLHPIPSPRLFGRMILTTKQPITIPTGITIRTTISIHTLLLARQIQRAVGNNQTRKGSKLPPRREVEGQGKESSARHSRIIPIIQAMVVGYKAQSGSRPNHHQRNPSPMSRVRMSESLCYEIGERSLVVLDRKVTDRGKKDTTREAVMGN